MKNIMQQTAHFAVIISLIFSNTLRAQSQRPSPISGAYTLNAFVVDSYNLFENTNSVKARVSALQADLVNKSPLDLNPTKMLAELSECGNLITGLLPTATNLIASATDMPTKVKDELKSKPLRIPGALIQMKYSLKAIKESQQNITSLLRTVIPDIKAKIKEKTGADTNQIAGKAETTPAAAAPLLNALPEITTTLTVDNTSYAETQKIVDTLKSNSNIKAITKTFGNSKAVFVINHSGTTDELLDYLTRTSYGKATDVTHFEKGKIILKMK